jgi:hypothetical protein
VIKRDSRQKDVAATWTKLERRGDFIVLAEPSCSTETFVKHDYDLLFWATRKLGQWGDQVKDSGKKPTFQIAKNAFKDTILVGNEQTVPYVTEEELQKQLDHPQAPSKFAEEIVTRRWGFTPSTGATYIRRKKKDK